jgi:predicted DNA-binding protein
VPETGGRKEIMECPFLTNIKEGTQTMASADRQISFKMPSELADHLGYISNKMDINMSQMVRACLLLGMPVFEKNPILINVIDSINQYKKQQSPFGDAVV